MNIRSDLHNIFFKIGSTLQKRHPGRALFLLLLKVFAENCTLWSFRDGLITSKISLADFWVARRRAQRVALWRRRAGAARQHSVAVTYFQANARKLVFACVWSLKMGRLATN